MNTSIKGFLAVLLALPLATGAASRPATPFTDAELDQLLAPVALYPDTVLSHVLIAATVPDDVEEAARWLDRHPDVHGQAAVDAVEGKDWDPSVKALVAFPEVIERMDEDPDWTENLGEAFLDQESTVMDRVQVLRDRADRSGNLESVEHVRVVREREYIYLEPAVSEVVYVPYYDPWFVYGSWWWPSYPPHCWGWWGGRPARSYYGSAFYWGVGFHVRPSFYASSFNWPARHVVVTQNHRHYAPSPGYSGGSMRRDVPHDTRRQHGDSRGWQQDRRHDHRRDPSPRREDTPRRHWQGAPGANPGRQGRRSWTDVHRELSARREARQGGESRGHDDRGSTRIGGDVRTREGRRSESFDQGRDEGRRTWSGERSGQVVTPRERPESRGGSDRGWGGAREHVQEQRQPGRPQGQRQIGRPPEQRQHGGSRRER